MPPVCKFSHFKTYVNRIVKDKASRILRKLVDQGLLVKIDKGAKKTVSYRLPTDQKLELLFAGTRANKPLPP
jgi:hypothetical protein